MLTCKIAILYLKKIFLSYALNDGKAIQLGDTTKGRKFINITKEN